MGDFWAGILGAIFGARWGRRIVARRNDRLRREGKTQASVRAVDGAVPGLSMQWMPTTWSVSAGRMTNFSVVVPVTKVWRDKPRTPGVRESLWSVDPDMEIYRAESNGKPVEIALLPTQRDLVRDALGATVLPSTTPLPDDAAQVRAETRHTSSGIDNL